MRFLKIFFAIIFFILAFIFIITGLVSFSIPEIGIGYAIGFTLSGGFFTFAGIKLINKPKSIHKKEETKKQEKYVLSEQEKEEAKKEYIEQLAEIMVKNTKISTEGDSVEISIIEAPATTIKETDDFVILYRDTKGDETLRRIFPNGIKRDSYGDFTVRAFCYMRNKYREFKLSRIRKILYNDSDINGEEFINLFPYFKKNEPEAAIEAIKLINIAENPPKSARVG